MPFNTQEQREATRTFTLRWSSDQGDHDCEITYRLGVVGNIPDQELRALPMDEWIERIIVAWDVIANGKPLPPTAAALKEAEGAGDPIPFWFKALVMDGIMSDTRPPTLTSRISDDSL